MAGPTLALVGCCQGVPERNLRAGLVELWVARPPCKGARAARLRMGALMRGLKPVRVVAQGMGDANQFVKGFRLFKEFIKTHSFIKINIDNNKIVTGNIFDGCNICFTGVRDEEIELFIKKNNGIISTINKANILIYKTKDVGQKFKTAEEKEIHLVQIDDFKTKYCIQ